MRIAPLLLAALALLVLCVSPAFASGYNYDQLSNEPMTISEYEAPLAAQASLAAQGDLGDESTSVEALGIAAGAAALGAAVVHKRRTET